MPAKCAACALLFTAFLAPALAAEARELAEYNAPEHAIAASDRHFEPVTAKDFTVKTNAFSISLGQEWNPDVSAAPGRPLRDDYAGEVPFGEQNYKFYRHTYPGLDIYSANLWWDKAHRDFDDYIVAQITFSAPQYKTPRGAGTGDTAEDIERLYGPAKYSEEEGEQWLSYISGEKVLSFAIVKNKVASVTLSYDNGG